VAVGGEKKSRMRITKVRVRVTFMAANIALDDGIACETIETLLIHVTFTIAYSISRAFRGTKGCTMLVFDHELGFENFQPTASKPKFFSRKNFYPVTLKKKIYCTLMARKKSSPKSRN
jgi:hypothetical protein